MRIEVGKTYVTPQGEEVTILYKTDMFSKDYDMFLPYVGSNGKRYDEEGEAQWIFADPADTLREKSVEQPATLGGMIGKIVAEFIDHGFFSKF